MPSVEIKIFAAIILFEILCFLPALARVFTNILACLIKWKESVNLQMSSARLDRNFAALGLIPVFIFICTYYHLYPKTEGMDFLPSLGYTSLVFAAYCLVRFLCRLIFRSARIEKDKYVCATASAYNFFIIATVLMGLTAAICNIFDVNGSVKDILLWELIAVYAVLLLRKTQIFTYYRGFFSGILYLCTLEILPTALLVASVLFL